MANLFEMKRPLTVGYSNGDKEIMVAYYRHSEGLVYLPSFWEKRPEGQKAVVIKGELKGEGPWKIADVVITLVGCQNTDADFAQMLAEWEFHVQSVASDYYQPENIRALAREYGALI